MLAGREILIGVCGGIAAYKTCELVSQLRQAGAGVQVLMTLNAARFVTPLTFAALSERPVYTELWSGDLTMAHIEMTNRADLMAICPATANMIAKLAGGLADDLLTTTVIAVDIPVLLAPAMNTRMLENPATQANLETLRSRGLVLLDSPAGPMACGTVGAGRMAEPAEIFAAIEKHLPPASGQT